MSAHLEKTYDVLTSKLSLITNSIFVYIILKSITLPVYVLHTILYYLYSCSMFSHLHITQYFDKFINLLK